MDEILQETINPLIVFPPGWTPFAPYLACPMLKGYLKERGVDCEIRDLNVEFYDYMMSGECLERRREEAQCEFDRLDKIRSIPARKREAYLTLLRALKGGDVVEKIERAKRIIRSDRYFHEGSAAWVNGVLSDACRLISASYDGLSLMFNKVSLKYSRTSTAQVLASLGDRRANPYIEFYERVLPDIAASGATLLGISITAGSQLIAALTLARLVRSQVPRIKHIVFGGNYITRLAALWDKPHPFFELFDYLVTYEGEESLFKLIRCLERGEDLSAVPNLVYVRNGALIKNKLTSPPVETLPIPEFENYNRVSYFLPNLVLPVFSSRNCFNRCTFCTIPFSTYGEYRRLSEQRVYETMRVLSARHGVRHFSFIDDTFSLPSMRALAAHIKQDRADFQWYCETRFSPFFDQRLCRELYDGGCRKIQFGLESYNQRILDLMAKNVKLEWIEPTIENCQRSGIGVHMFFMVGFPGETREEALRTIDFTRRMLERGRDLYGIDHSSRGWDTFGLDKFSGVWLNPEHFKIKISPDRAMEDLSLSADFTAGCGMSPEQACELIVEFNKSAREVLGKEQWLPLYDGVIPLNSEEDNFLRICRRTPGRRRERKPNAIQIGHCPPTAKVRLKPTITRLPVRHDVRQPSLRFKKVVILWNRKDQRVEIVAGPSSRSLDLMKTQGLSLGEVFDAGLSADFQRLADSRMLTVTNREQASQPKRRALLDATIHCNSELIISRREKSGSYVVFNRSSGRAIRMNATSAQIVRAFSGGASTRSMLGRLKEDLPGLNEERVLKLINLCLECSVLQFS